MLLIARSKLLQRYCAQGCHRMGNFSFYPWYSKMYDTEWLQCESEIGEVSFTFHLASVLKKEIDMAGNRKNL